MKTLGDSRNTQTKDVWWLWVRETTAKFMLKHWLSRGETNWLKACGFCGWFCEIQRCKPIEQEASALSTETRKQALDTISTQTSRNSVYAFFIKYSDNLLANPLRDVFASKFSFVSASWRNSERAVHEHNSQTAELNFHAANWEVEMENYSQIEFFHVRFFCAWKIIRTSARPTCWKIFLSGGNIYDRKDRLCYEKEKTQNV